VQWIAGSQVFVGNGVTAPLVDQDQELDPSTYPGDLMSATLAPGVRELPSPLDVQILDVVNGLAPPPRLPPATAENAPSSAPPSVPPPVASAAIASTTAVDHAVAALGNNAPAPAAAAAVVRGNAAGGHKAAVHGGTKAHAKAARTHARHVPHAGLAVQLSRRGPRGHGKTHHSP
jgi:hypothetical protein